MSRCDVVGEKPQVWKDDRGWQCDQGTFCRTCKAVSLDRIVEDATWDEAMAAVADARPHAAHLAAQRPTPAPTEES